MLYRNEIAFGPFNLIAEERRLEKAGTAIRIGGRALDILLVLIDHAGTVVDKSVILERVWKSVNVDDVSMRVHINALRKALGDGVDGARYIINVPGRGYSFVEPVKRPKHQHLASAPAETQNLPRRLARMIGRSETIAQIAATLREQRFMTILGPGGIGKTSFAISVGHEMLATFDGGVHFIDLGPLSDPELLSNVILSALGVTVYSENLADSLIASLRDKKLLLILDGCEHVIEAVASLADRIFLEAPKIYLLATSRENLDVEGELIHRLLPLESPPESEDIDAESALKFTAVQLFVERANVSSKNFSLNDRDAPLVAEMCRRLDGIALAIELAASRVDAYGIRGIAELLGSYASLPWRGRRTAVPRHQTLGATLDWSYNLLSQTERLILCRIAIFVGRFTREDAAAVVPFGEINHGQMLDALASLIGKSLLSADTSGDVTYYRLLDTTRAYALEKLSQQYETRIVSMRHAIHYCNMVKEIIRRAGETPGLNWKSQFTGHVANVRVALAWSISRQGDSVIAMNLAAASARLFLEFALFAECHRWMGQVLDLLDDTGKGTFQEIEIQTAFGQSTMFVKGSKEDALAAFTRALELAEGLNHLKYQLKILANLHLFHERMGGFRLAFEFAKRSEAVAILIGEPLGIAVANSVLGISCHLAGDHELAISCLKSALALAPVSRRIEPIYFGFDYDNRARITMARALWIQGRPDQAVKAAIRTVEMATQLGQPITLCIALIWAISVLIWINNLALADGYTSYLKMLAEKHSLKPYQPLAVGFEAELSIQRGHASIGVTLLQECLESLRINRYGLMTTAFMTSLAEGLLMTAQPGAALNMIEAAIEQVQANGDFYIMPEVLRVKATILGKLPDVDRGRTEAIYLDAIDLAERQSAQGWKLRAGTSLATMYYEQGRKHECQDLLLPIYEVFTEGFQTLDVILAKQLLGKL